MATAQENREQNYISNARQAADALWTAYLDLLAMQNEWNAQDYANNSFTGTGANLGITSAMIGAVVFDTANAIKTVMDAGNATNITTILE